MNVYVQCEGCGAKDRPKWVGGPMYAMQQAGSASGFWDQPEGWAELFDVQLCRICADEGRKVLRDFATSRAKAARDAKKPAP